MEALKTYAQDISPEFEPIHPAIVRARTEKEALIKVNRYLWGNYQSKDFRACKWGEIREIQENEIPKNSIIIQ